MEPTKAESAGSQGIRNFCDESEAVETASRDCYYEIKLRVFAGVLTGTCNCIVSRQSTLAGARLRHKRARCGHASARDAQRRIRRLLHAPHVVPVP